MLPAVIKHDQGLRVKCQISSLPDRTEICDFSADFHTSSQYKISTKSNGSRADMCRQTDGHDEGNRCSWRNAKAPKNDGSHKTSLRSRTWSDQLFNIPARKYHRLVDRNSSPELYRAATFSGWPDKHSHATALTGRPHSARAARSFLVNNHARQGKLFI